VLRSQLPHQRTLKKLIPLLPQRKLLQLRTRLLHHLERSQEHKLQGIQLQIRILNLKKKLLTPL
jgi:hypothetical protein